MQAPAIPEMRSPTCELTESGFESQWHLLMMLVLRKANDSVFRTFRRD